MLGLSWSNDSHSNAGGSAATVVPDWSMVTTQPTRDTLVLQVGGWACGHDPTSLKSLPRILTRGGHVPPRNVQPSDEEKEDLVRAA